MLAAHRIRSIPFTSFCISRAAGESSPTLSNAPLESPGGYERTPAGTAASSRIDSGTPASRVPFTFPWPPAQVRKQRKQGRDLLQLLPRPGGLERGSFPRRGFNDYNIAKEPLFARLIRCAPLPPPPRPAQPSPATPHLHARAYTLARNHMHTPHTCPARPPAHLFFCQALCLPDSLPPCPPSHSPSLSPYASPAQISRALRCSQVPPPPPSLPLHYHCVYCQPATAAAHSIY